MQTSEVPFCPSQRTTPFCNRWLLCILLLGALPLSHAAADITIENVNVGFAGHVLLGRWVPIRIALSRFPESGWLHMEIETVDGDAVPVVFQQDVKLSASPEYQIQGLVRIGRLSGLNVKVFDLDGRLVAQRQFGADRLARDHSILPSTSALTVALGADELPASAAEFAVNQEPDNAYAVMEKPLQMPNDWLGYESVSTLYLSTQNVDQLNQLSQQQISAMTQWIRMGGRVLVSSGKNAAAVFGSNAPLAPLAPSTFINVQNTRETGAIEIFVNSNDPLTTADGAPLAMSVFESPTDNVSLQVDGRPAISHRLFGFGRISFLAFDLGDEPIKSWPGKNKLIGKALMKEATSESDTASTRSGRVTHLGYEDFVGQLRSALDRFGNVSFITFTTVAILIGIFVLAIGPGDFFFLKRVVRRMEWTWVSFIGLSLAFCALAILAVSWTKSATLEVNQVEVIDVDADQMLVRGTAWAHIYSPTTATYNIRFAGTNRHLGALDQAWISWQGLPGAGLGGMQTRTDLGLYRGSYRSQLSTTDDHFIGSRLLKVPLQSASTKAIVGRWSLQLDRAPSSQLRQNPNTDAVLGTLTNPFPVALSNCVLLYGGWAYVLDRTLEPNETIDVEGDMREKTIKGFFTRRQQAGQDDVNTPWDPSDTSIARIANMMMFYQAIGGEVYSKLTHNYQAYLDLSDHLKLGRAVLLGQQVDVSTDLLINDQPTSGRCDKKFTFMRAVFPVEPRSR